ncbi:hypothetical protein [Pseudomonas sp. 37 R 15]|nr:hypothetical protein [Pseudomonas sp. 37 R 15]
MLMWLDSSSLDAKGALLMQKLLAVLLERQMISPLPGQLFVLHPKNLRLMLALILVRELAHKSVIKMGKKSLMALQVVSVQTGVWVTYAALK